MVRPEQIDLAKLTAQVIATLGSLASAKGIQIEVELSREVPTIVTDPGRLTQVLYNYLSNATKFSPRDSSVLLRIKPEGVDSVRFEVEDRGVGIDAVDLPKLFQDYEQLAAGAGREHQGTGLGLAVTKRLVEVLGGSVGVTSTKGVGSVFYAVLPGRPARSVGL